MIRKLPPWVSNLPDPSNFVVRKRSGKASSVWNQQHLVTYDGCGKRLKWIQWSRWSEFCSRGGTLEHSTKNKLDFVSFSLFILQWIVEEFVDLLLHNHLTITTRNYIRVPDIINQPLSRLNSKRNRSHQRTYLTLLASRSDSNSVRMSSSRRPLTWWSDGFARGEFHLHLAHWP